MIVVCIDCGIFNLQLSKGSRYESLNINCEYNPYDGIPNSGYRYVNIFDDLGQMASYPFELFRPLYIIREDKLNELGI